MDDLLKHWKSKSPMAEFSDRSSSNDHSSRVARRRLTTTIGRSVEIQTEFEHKSCQEKGISTEGTCQSAILCKGASLLLWTFFQIGPSSRALLLGRRISVKVPPKRRRQVKIKRHSNRQAIKCPSLTCPMLKTTSLVTLVLSYLTRPLGETPKHLSQL